jgi:hypothetical protein
MTDDKKGRKSPDSLIETAENAKIGLTEAQLTGVTGGADNTKTGHIEIVSYSFGNAPASPSLKTK